MTRYLFAIFLVCLFSVSAFPRTIERHELQPVLAFVDSLGPMPGSPLKDIVAAFREAKFNETETAYGLYCWVAQNIEFDYKAAAGKRKTRSTASATIIDRSAKGEGYANLYKALCDLARIECVVIQGFAKATADGIGILDEQQRHAWNAIRMSGTWYYVDAAWGAGFPEPRFKGFTKEFTDVWFMTDRDLFSLSHYPDEKQWHFESETVTRWQYSNAPVICAGAVLSEVFPFEETRGKLRGRRNTCKPLSFDVRKPELIKSVGVAIGEEIKAAEYSVYENDLLIEVPFEKAGDYTVSIYINNKPAFRFKASVADAYKR